MESFLKKNLNPQVKNFLRKSFSSLNYIVNKEFTSTNLLENKNFKVKKFQNFQHFAKNYTTNIKNKEEIVSPTIPTMPLNKVEDPFKNRLTMELNGLISNMRNLFNKKAKIQFDTYIMAISKVDRVDSDLRSMAEDLFLEIFRSKSFYSEYLEYPKNDFGHKNFSELFYNMSKISKLTDEDMKTLEKLYFDLDKPPKEFTIQQRTKIFDAFYYYKRNFNKERCKNISKMQQNIFTSFSEFFTSFVYSEIGTILQNIVFLSEEEIEFFAPETVKRMNYTINPEFSEKMKLSLEKKLDLLQFYPRILYVLKNKNPSLFETESKKIENFLIENSSNAEEIAPELILCNISNFYIWNTPSPSLMEAYITFFYRNLASFKQEFTLELFFLLLNTDFNLLKNKQKGIQLLNLIYQTTKNVKTHKILNFENVKEVYYFEETQKELEVAFQKWDSQNPALEFDNSDHYHKKIFREFIKKSIDLFPFAAIDYEDKLFDRLYDNLKNNIKF